jgi:pseudouridylate synthase
MTTHSLLDCTPEVREALAAGRPVVALESTIVSHGMPYPQNVQTAREVEGVVREHGAVPATIAVIAGRLKVGLSDGELEQLGSDPSFVKVSHGATTVASTLRIAVLAGIRVFATGGTGGVHRGAATTLDISADLPELARSPVCVVSAGVKSILDIGLTLEYLETLGVPVMTLGAEEFPAFYSRSSGHASPLGVDSPEQAAAVLRAKWELCDVQPGGVLLANPIPHEAEIPAAEITPHIEAALADMARLGISGKAATPYLLGRITEITGGRSLVANIALVKNNAAVAAQVAAAYCGLGMN